ncbi:MAG TPA: tetratricopeptide repeat protein [Vicinamibacteria bacterium]|nr:tetratricopeptide repeat protein [Vicinamibacteria bacterium]
MACPRCGFTEPGPLECPSCGVVFAKLDRPARPAPARRDRPSPARRFSWLDGLLLAAFVAAAAVIVLRWTRAVPPATTSLSGARPPGPRDGSSESEPLAQPTSPVVPEEVTEAAGGLPSTLPVEDPSLEGVPSVPDVSTGSSGLALSSEDAAAYRSLLDAVVSRVEVESSHVEQAETLLGRHPGVPEVGRMAEGVLELAAQQASRRGRTVDAARYRERAAELQPESRGAWLRLVNGHEADGEWREAEQAARRGLSALPDESALHLALARALARQGRDEDAADVLRRRLASRDDEAARRALAQLERDLQSVAGLARRASSHFDVRFEGREDASLGAALLRVLEEKYSWLARTLDFEPDRAIPVVLLPDETFRSATSAPDWASAFYSHGDGRIRVRTRDLTAGFVPVDLERTLTHELTHAFIHARTRGAVPDDINEGLAQYLSGKRLGYRLDPARAAVGDGRMKVDDFYDAALSFVEYLVERYRQPALNDLLKHAGETGSVDQAFRSTFHQTYEETRAEWLKQLQ